MQTDNEEMTLTIAEAGLIISQKRNRLYNVAMTAVIIFCLVLSTLLIVFKLNEEFFDSNSRLGILMESMSIKDENPEYPKINVEVNYSDENNARLVIPTPVPLAEDSVSISDEFTKNKFVITLKDYSPNIGDEIKLVSDSEVMEAVGVYRQNGDVVVEVYCRDTYDYRIDISEEEIVLNFDKADENYDYKAVIWIPYDDKNRLARPEWKQDIIKYADENKIKLYMTSDMTEEYDQSEVVEFANNIKADMIIGVEVEKTQDTVSTIYGVCNTSYFISEYDSARLAIQLMESFESVLGYDIKPFYEADENYPLVLEATVPSSIVKLSPGARDSGDAESEYRLNEKISTALENTMSNVVTEWRQGVYESE